MGSRRSPGRALWLLSALGAAAIVATVVLVLGIQRRVIRSQRARERATILDAAAQRCDLLQRVLLARIHGVLGRHPQATSLAQVADEVGVELREFRFLREAHQGVHAMVVDERLRPVTALDPACDARMLRCAARITEGAATLYTLPEGTEGTAAMPKLLCATCPIERGGRLLGGLILHKELDPVGDVFAAVHRTMAWTVAATQLVLLLALAAVASLAWRAQARAERARAEDERLAALGNLAAGIAHEIRNPLNTISLTCRYLERYVAQSCEKPECRAEFNRNFEIVASELGRLTRTLDSFLLLARPADLELVDCDLDDAVDDALALYAQELADAGIRVERHRIGDLPVSADADRLQQVFTNLIRNGIQAMPDGGVLSVTSERRDGRARIAFADTGPGISSEVLHRIFEPYFSTRRSGLGLGLSLSQKIVAAHGGAVEVANGPNAGAVFTVTLPLREPAPGGSGDG